MKKLAQISEGYFQDKPKMQRADKKRPSFCAWYFGLCLSELPFEFAKYEIEKYKGEMPNRLNNKSCVMNSDSDKMMHSVLLCILRNALSKYLEYAYIKDRQPYVSKKDRRLYFEMRRDLK